MTSLRFRAATHTDLSAVWSVITQARDLMQAQGLGQWDSTYPTYRMPVDDLAAGTLFVATVVASTATTTTATTTTVIAAEEGDELVACVTIDPAAPDEYRGFTGWTATARPAAYVHRLAVAAAHRGRGVAHALMLFVEQHARSLSYGVLRLDTSPENLAAMRLYTRLGYTHAGELAIVPDDVPYPCLEKLLS